MKIQVGIFFGGRSVEHEVSVISAAQTAAALDREKYEVIPVYITKDNEMYTGGDLLRPAAYRDLPGLLRRSLRVCLFREKGKVWLMRYPAKLWTKAFVACLDLAFPVIHGTNGEDGSLQGFFQLYGLPYVGSDVGASAWGMDKWAGKCLLQSAGLPVLPGCCLRSARYGDDPEGFIRAAEAFHAYPLIVKPVNLGSSVGVSPAGNAGELRDGVELAASFSERVLLEPMLTHIREINCAVLGDAEHTEASACEEVLSTGEILSYRDKYEGGGQSSAAGSKSGKAGGFWAAAGKSGAGGAAGAKGMAGSLRKLPAELPADKEAEIKSLAQEAFHALNCSGVARVDFLFDQEDGRVYINELNTIPGSLSFYLWEAAGKSFRRLTDELIGLAQKRKRFREKLIWSNEVNILAGIPGGAKGSKR